MCLWRQKASLKTENDNARTCPAVSKTRNPSKKFLMNLSNNVSQ